MLRRAERADIDVLAAIHAAAFAHPDVWSRDVFDLQLQLPNVHALLYSNRGMILLRTASDEAEVLTLAVVPTARRSGVALRLLEEAVAMIAALGVRALFLEVSVDNVAARATYSKAGFIHAGARPRYYSDGSDALVLRLDLDSPRPLASCTI